ncbi:hypothetical protein IRJ41_024974 [Triplophysa rosa]|uniref:Uncharacterized protein n=1 Tax=Triplophysa rosa TaxID=992332 RepID=A0A9W7TA00_TRIRA|nr:hypothetical protein IRJ41_024974 [Triplophysa rosa]
MNPKSECVRQTPRFRRPHRSVLSTTRSHRQLVKAVKIWKTPFVSSSNVTPGALKPRSFKERLMCVEMHRKASEVSTAPKSIACSIRDLQLCSSDSSPSPLNRPLESQDTRRRRPVHTRRYRRQLEWYHTLSRNKRPQRLNLEGQRSQTTLRMTGPSSHRKRRQRSSPSAQSPPEFQTPVRKTSRRLWRRQLDSSSSDSSRSTDTTPAQVKKTRRQKQNNTYKPCDNTNRLKPSWTEFNFLDIHSDLITEASPAHKTRKNLSAMSKKDKRKDSPVTKPSVQTSDVKSSQKIEQKVNKTKTREDQLTRKNIRGTNGRKISDTGENEQRVHFKTPSSKTKRRGFKPRDSDQSITAAPPRTPDTDRSFHLKTTEKHTR